MPDNRDAVLKEIDDAIRIMQWGYSVWFGAYAVFAILTVGLPGIAAMGLFGDWHDKVLAGTGALFAALLHALKPHEYATGYDAGVQLAWKTRVALVGGLIDEPAASRDIGKAIDLTTFKYGAPSSISKSKL